MTDHSREDTAIPITSLIRRIMSQRAEDMRSLSESERNKYRILAGGRPQKGREQK
jgi:hypothetical protein